MPHADHRRASLTLILIAVPYVLFGLLAGTWIVIGHFTARSSWARASGGSSIGTDPSYYRPRRAAILIVDPSAQPYAQALRDELITRHWLTDVRLLQPNQPADAVDFFICLGRAETGSDKNLLSWRRQLRIRVNAGSHLFNPTTTYIEKFSIPRRRVSLTRLIEGDAYGDGMEPPGMLAPPQFAHYLADELARLLDPAAGHVSGELPPQFFGKPLTAGQRAHPPLVDASDLSDAWLVSDGAGFMQHRRTCWIRYVDGPAEPYFQSLLQQLKAAGWRGGADADNLHMTRGTQVIDAYTTRDWQRDQVAFDNQPSRSVCIIEYADRFNNSQAAEAIAWLFDQHADTKTLLVYEPRMTRDQKRVLLGMLEASPVERSQWWVDMARRYRTVMNDPVKAEQALRHAHELAMADKDFRQIHQSIRWEAEQQKLADLSQPMTRQQLLDAGAHDLTNGSAAGDLKFGGRWVGFINAGEDLRLLVFKLDGHELGRSFWRAHSMSSTSTRLRSTHESDRFGGWDFEWTITEQPTGCHIEASATREAGK